MFRDRKGSLVSCAPVRHEETFLEPPEESPLMYMTAQNKLGVLLGGRKEAAMSIFYRENGALFLLHKSGFTISRLKPFNGSHYFHAKVQNVCIYAYKALCAMDHLSSQPRFSDPSVVLGTPAFIQQARRSPLLLTSECLLCLLSGEHSASSSFLSSFWGMPRFP